jgi:predicted nucleic acid-binding protein
MSAVLLDTNILVYAYIGDTNDPRVIRARQVLEESAREQTGRLGVQNLAEFCSVCLTKAKPPPSAEQLVQWVGELTSVFAVLSPTAETVAVALRGVKEHRLSFWDAMLWALAHENGVRRIASEDFQHELILEGVSFHNPFR